MTKRKNNITNQQTHRHALGYQHGRNGLVATIPDDQDYCAAYARGLRERLAVKDHKEEIIKCKDRVEAVQHMLDRGFRYERHEPYAFTDGFDFYQGPVENLRGCVRTFKGEWRAVFYER